MTRPTPSSDASLGWLLAISAYGMWGLSPLFWKQLGGVPAEEQLAHRVIWAALLFLALLVWRGQLREVFDAVRSPRTLATMLAASAMLCVNWGTYLYAVVAERIVEVSVGYYLNPLFNVLLGTLVLGETLRPRQKLALALASLGVAVMTWQAGVFPWLALLVSGAFALYGLIRKTAHVAALPGSFVEAAALGLMALPFVLSWEAAGTGHFLPADRPTFWLVAAGPMTALPVWCFAEAARRLSLSTMGFIQFMTPTMQLLLAVFVYGESFTLGHALAFFCIWSGVAIYARDTWTVHREGVTVVR